MRIRYNGYVGIGTSNPVYTLHTASYGNTGTAAALLWGEHYGVAIGVNSSSASKYAFNVLSNLNADETGTTGGSKSLFYVRADGNIGIGTDDPGSKKLAVEDTVSTRKVQVTQGSWADFVFEPGYRLPSLQEVEQYIKTNKHLPDVPSAAQIKQDGLDIGEMQKLQMQKMEELMLYMIELKKENEMLKERVKKLERRT